MNDLKAAGIYLSDHQEPQRPSPPRPPALPSRLTPLGICRLVAERLGSTVGDMRLKSRRQEFVVQRRVAMTLLRAHTDLSLPEIGRMFNRRHPDVIYHLRGMVTQAYRQTEEWRLTIKLSEEVGGE